MANSVQKSCLQDVGEIETLSLSLFFIIIMAAALLRVLEKKNAIVEEIAFLHTDVFYEINHDLLNHHKIMITTYDFLFLKEKFSVKE